MALDVISHEKILQWAKKTSSYKQEGSLLYGTSNGDEEANKEINWLNKHGILASKHYDQNGDAKGKRWQIWIDGKQ